MSVTEIASGKWNKIFTAAGVNLESYYVGPNPKHVPCPFCGGKDRFRFDHADKTNEYGSYFCSHCGAGKGFTFLINLLGCGFDDAVTFVKDVVGDVSSLNIQPQKKIHVPDVFSLSEAEERRRVEKMQSMWNSASPITEDSPVWKYLAETRRLPIKLWPEITNNIRWLKNTKYLVKGENKVITLPGTYDVMLLKVAGSNGKVANLHRTYLQPNGKKAEIFLNGEKLNAKKLCSGIPNSHGAIRLTKASSDVLAVTEGIETGLAVLALYRMPVWVGISATMMQSMAFPDHVKKVIIFGDNDYPDSRGNRAGQFATEKLIRNLQKQGKVGVDMTCPEEGRDWWDIWYSRITGTALAETIK